MQKIASIISTLFLCLLDDEPQPPPDVPAWMIGFHV
jgi:hypothetical protein